MSRSRRAGAVGLIVGLAGVAFALTPLGMDLERDLGLRSLFWARGPVPPPPDVVIVGMDKRSADRLDLPSPTELWPRTLHAELLARLVDAGAAVVLFDVFFRTARSAEGDAALARAIARSGRTVLFQYIERDTIFRREVRPTRSATTEALISPHARFSTGAAGLAPFPLPKVPARVDQFWTFKTGVGDAPTLPVVALQILALQAGDGFERLLGRVGADARRQLVAYLRSPRRPADLRRLMADLRRRFTTDPGAAKRALQGLDGEGAAAPADRGARALEALVRTYGGPTHRFLNFYGPPGTIPTVPYHAMVRGDAARGPGRAPDLAGKVVFVGVSEFSKVERKEGFYTVFSRDDGIDLSGVELVATSFANLLTGSAVRQLDAYALVATVVAFGGLAGFAAAYLAGLRAVIAVLGIAVLYFAAAEHAFATRHLWLPVGAPLLVELPLAMILGLFAQYVVARRLSENFGRVVAFFLPDDMASAMAGGTDPKEIPHELRRGVVLVTDVDGYTALSETLSPSELHDLTTRYQDVVTRAVKDRGGDVVRATGDGMISVWTFSDRGAELERRRDACLAALDIRDMVRAFNDRNDPRRLPTRIGLHAGEFVIGIVGGEDTLYQRDVTGEAVNTASRIEQRNKELATEVLVSEPVASGIEDLSFRPRGPFTPRGRTETIGLFEIVGRRDDAR